MSTAKCGQDHRFGDSHRGVELGDKLLVASQSRPRKAATHSSASTRAAATLCWSGVRSALPATWNDPSRSIPASAATTASPSRRCVRDTPGRRLQPGEVRLRSSKNPSNKLSDVGWYGSGLDGRDPCQDWVLRTPQHLPDGSKGTHNRSVVGSIPTRPTDRSRWSAGVDSWCSEAARHGPRARTQPGVTDQSPSAVIHTKAGPRNSTVPS